MFAPEHGPDMYLIQEQPGQDQTYDTAGMSQVGVLEVDFKRYPRFAKVPFKTVVLQPGDCLYVPGEISLSAKTKHPITSLNPPPPRPPPRRLVHAPRVLHRLA
jgi:hypothetical protein